LEQQIESALARAEVQTRFRDAGLQPAFLGSEAFTRFIAQDAQTNRRLIREAGITAD
jgi:tripartite-type tricarboxylate transporter receptor subunit TctC